MLGLYLCVTMGVPAQSRVSFSFLKWLGSTPADCYGKAQPDPETGSNPGPWGCKLIAAALTPLSGLEARLYVFFFIDHVQKAMLARS